MSNLKKIQFGDSGVVRKDHPSFVKKPDIVKNKFNEYDIGQDIQKAQDFFANPSMMWRAVSDRSVLGIIPNILNYSKYNDEANGEYSAFTDPQLDGYIEQFPEKFFDSRSPQESAFRLSALIQKADDYKNPYFAATRLVSEILLDPSSLLLLSKPLRFAVMGNNPNKFSNIGKLMIAEEGAKQVADRDRTYVDAVVMTAIGGALHKLSPMLSKYDKRYNKYKYDPSNDRGVVIDIDDLADVTKTEAGTTTRQLLLQNQSLYKTPVKPGMPKNVTELLKVFQNQYPTMKIVLGGKSGKTVGGKYIPAYYNKYKDEMVLDIDGIKQMWKDGRPFKINTIDGEKIIPFKKKDFRDINEWVDFVLRHEFAHKTYRRRKGETRAAYENRINKIAYQQILDNRKDVQRVGSSMLDDYKVLDQETYNYGKFQNELFQEMKWNDITYKNDTLRSSMVSGLTKAAQVLSPLDFFIHSGSKTGKLFAMNLFNSPLLYKFNKDGIASPDTVEQMRNLAFGPNLIEVLDEGYKVAQKITAKLQGKEREGIAKILNWKGFSSLKFKGVFTPEEVFREATYARLNGNKHDIPEIAAYAQQYVGDKYFNPIRKKINELGMFMIPIIKKEEFADFLKAYFSNPRNKVYKNPNTQEEWTKAEADKYIAGVALDSKLAKQLDDQFYVPVNYKYDQISTRWEEFSSLLAKQMALAKDKKTGAALFTSDEITDIVSNFKNYSPDAAPIRPKNVKPGMLYQLKGGYFSKHLKTRYLKDIDYKPLFRAGFIEDNLEITMSHYFRSVAPDIAMTEKFGDPYGFGWFYDQGKTGFAPGMIQIGDELQKQGAKFYGLTEAEFVKRFNIEMEKAEAIVSLVKNKYGLPDNPNGYYFKTATMIKIFHNISMLTGITQIADIGRIITVDGLMGTSSKLLEAFSNGMGRAIFDKGFKEAKLAFQAIDMSIGSVRADIISGNDALRSSFTGTEKVFQQLNTLAFRYGNLQSPWNAFIKVTATILVNTKLLDIIERMAKGKAKQWEIEYIGNLGIGTATKTDLKILDDILRNYKKHGQGKNTDKGVYSKEHDQLKFPNTDLWDNADATMKFRAALNKEVDNVIVTPGLSDAPLFANTVAGSVLFQYKKFGLGYTRRVLYRGMQMEDGRFLEGLAALTAIGMMIDAIRAKQTNAQYKNKTLREKVLDGAERGGVGGMFTDIDRIIMALSDNKIGVRPTLLGIQRPYGTSMKRKMGSIAPIGSTIGNIYEILYDWGRGRHNHHTARRLRRMIPYNNLWYADFLFDKIEKGLY